MSFIDTRLLDGEVSLDLIDGPEWSTAIPPPARSGFEVRNKNWQYPLWRGELGERLLTTAELRTIQAAFNACAGRLHTFRIKSWSDYAVTLALGNGVLGAGVGSGLATYQCGKRYQFGATIFDRAIKYLVTGTLGAYRNGTLIGGASFALTTGIATLPAISSFGISGITKANPGVVTATGHTFTNGQQIFISGVGGMTQVNNLLFTIGGVAANVFNIGVNTTSYGTYTSGGTAFLYPQPSDALRWQGEFDLHARFDTDQLRTQFRAIE
ncbi:MAG: DUF2460 domain-containing protein, partial [Gammaproteobacteria bacterium]